MTLQRRKVRAKLELDDFTPLAGYTVGLKLVMARMY